MGPSVEIRPAENPAGSNETGQMLTKVYELNAQQLLVMKRQLRWFRATTVMLVVAFAILIIFLGSMFARISKTIQDIEVVSSQLADADLPAMINQVNKLVDSSQQSVEAASSKIESIDIDALNQSIHDLNAIIEPLARLFGAR